MKINNLKLINSLREFKENWNGYDGKGFTKELCDFSTDIIKKLDEKDQPKVFPTGRESIQFEYEKRNGEYLEFEIYSPKRIEMFKVLENQTELEKHVDLEELEELVKEFNGT